MVSILIVLLSACGGGSDDPKVASSGDAPSGTSSGSVESDGGPIAVLAAAPEATAATDTARVAFQMEGTGEMPISMAAEGLIDFANKRTSMEMDLGEMMASMGAPSGVDGRMQFVLDDLTMYMRSGLFSAMGAPGVGPDTWIRFDLETLGQQQGMDLGQLMGGSTNDPRQGLAFLKGVTEGGVQEVGTEDVRGESTTHYKATVDLEKAASESGAFVDEASFRTFIDQFETTEIDVDAWLDDEGRVRRISMPLPLPASNPAAAQLGEMSMSMDYFDFGTDAEIEIPTDSVDFQKLMANAGGQGDTGRMPSDQNGY